MRNVKVALLQLSSCGLDVDLALRKGLAGCRGAAAQNADLCVLPELWNVGYSVEDAGVDWDRLRALATPVDGPFIAAFSALAAECQVAIAVTFLEAHGDSLRNSVALIDRRGTLRAVYAKVHTTEFGAERPLARGTEFFVSPLETRTGSVMIGMMICFDREFPESARALMLGGAEVIITPNACRLEESRLAQFRTRAFENAVGVAMTNYPRTRESGRWPTVGHAAMNGQSIAFSPIAFAADGEPLDPLLVRGGDEEGTFIADFDLEAIRAYRESSVWAGRYRQPDAYRTLVRPVGRPHRDS